MLPQPPYFFRICRNTKHCAESGAIVQSALGILFAGRSQKKTALQSEGGLKHFASSNKKSRQKIAGKKINTGTVSESPPHRAWVITVIVRQAVLLALDHSSPKPSQDLRPSGVSWVHSPIQWRDRAGVAPDFPIKPLRAPIPNMKLSRKSEYFRLLFWHHSVDLSTPDFHYPK